jgi:anti-anti-sigma factor
MTIAERPFALTVDASVVGSAAVVRLWGDLDLVSAPKLDACLLALAGDDVIVDLAEVTFMDTTGLDAIVVANRRANVAGRLFVLRAPSHHVMRVLEVTGLDRAVTFET